jgi:hypothetical protein
MTDTLTTKAELLTEIDRGWRELQAFVGYLSDEQLTQPTDAAGWTVADHLLHLADWEAGMTAILRGEDRPQAMGVDRAQWDSDDYDGMNEVMRQRHLDIHESRTSILAYLDQAHSEMLAALANVSDADLQKRYGDWQPLDQSDNPLMGSFMGNTYLHYEEHIPWMRTIGDQIGGDNLPPPTAAELIARTNAGWADLQAFVRSLSETQRTVPADPAGWTVNDHLLHLADWENGVVALAQGKPRREAMDVPADVWASGDDPINALMRSRHMDIRGSSDRVDQRRQQVHTALLAEIGKFTDADVQKPMRDWQPPEDGDYPVAYKFAGNTFLHYAEHIPWMKAIAEKG